MRHAPASRALIALLLICATTLTGCALPSRSTPPAPVRPVTLPPPPAELMAPPLSPADSPSWSESVRQLYRRWQLLLTETAPA